MIVGRSHTARHGKLLGSDDGSAFVRGGRAPCVVVFHGFTGTTTEVRPLLDVLVERGFAVRAPLLTGHGSHPAQLQDVTFDALVSEMQAELDAAREEHGDVVLAGFSLGSLVAMELAARRPEGLLGLVLLGNALTLVPPVSTALGFVERRGWKLPDWYLLKLWSADVRDPEQKARISSYDRDPLRAALEVYRAGGRVRARLGEITCPTLILHGARDRVCPSSNVALVASALGTSEVRTRIYAKSGHLVAADHDRADVAATVASFVASVVRAPGQPPVEP
ncbi:MAG TPA: alpha/beta fold hydrolase [Labilithrix sp.]|nr:alpha/beta fold hydrolase [Labilithrix sp.]